LCTVIGVLTALEHVRFTGVGERVDASMVGALTALVAIEPFDLLKSMGVPYRTGPKMARLGTFGLYRCADGYVAITAGGRQADALFQAIGKPDLGEDPRFKGPARARNYRELTAEIEAWTGRMAVEQCVAMLERADVPCAPVRTPGEAVEDPLARNRGDTVPLLHPTRGPIDDILVTGVPIHFGNAKVGFERPAPALGQHNQEVYGGLLGYSADHIAQLQANGVI
jgi:crotonobetainyl-CoA:carnitine CoA-transferase CaiB-like acyl-CoA transferase